MIKEKYLNSDVYDYNDASASSFGWSFQYNAGIFLFLFYSNRLVSIVMENDKQDIQINLTNGEKIYAQAKSAQSPLSISKSNCDEKTIDAIISLVRTSINNIGKYVYVTNIPSVIDPSNILKNSVQMYADFNEPAITNQIDSLFLRAVCGIDQKKAKYRRDSKKAICDEVKKAIESFDKNGFGLCLIDNYYSENRYTSIAESIERFLYDKIGTSVDDAKIICNKIHNYWRSKFEDSASTGIGYYHNKVLTIKELVWPIIVYWMYNSGSDDLIFKNNCFEDPPSLSTMTDSNLYISEQFMLNCERFDISNRIINDLNSYKLVDQKNRNDFAFIKEKWSDYKTLFDSLFENGTNESVKEYSIKYYLYHVICNSAKFIKLSKYLGERNRNDYQES